ncbi:MAG: 4Fe-4S dicluster domain-containing protein [Elusimicrobiota bacterium]|nr:4Fe-4S dicluster domain-containing protein [Elusimicrobiota bacterium]
MKKILFVDQEKCTGCRMCEVVCSWKHEGECNPALSRIQVVSDRSKSANFTVVCEQCEKALCQESCPAGAIYYNAEFGAYIVDEKKCIGCKICLSVCPVGAIGFNTKNGIAIKCDLCEGEPQCVKYCPLGAIEFIEPDKVSLKKKHLVAEKFIYETATGQKL